MSFLSLHNKNAQTIIQETLAETTGFSRMQ